MINIKKYYNPNRKIEPYKPKDWKKKYPEFCISQLPGPAIVKKENLKPGVICAFDYIDDNYIVVDRSLTTKEYLYLGGFLAFFLFIFFSLLWKLGFSLGLLYMSIAIGSFSLIPSLWFFILAFSLPKEKKVVFDRMRGLVQLPGAFWDEPQLVRFKEMHAVLALRTRFQGGIDLVACRKGAFAEPLMLPFGFGKALQSWSFWVWYMDKNRPLPPGEALDPYRQRDYERRKKEGFPPPLHPSYIETPEHFTDEYYCMNEENKKVPGRFNMSIIDEHKKLARLRGEKYEEKDHQGYYGGIV